VLWLFDVVLRRANEPNKQAEKLQKGEKFNVELAENNAQLMFV